MGGGGGRRKPKKKASRKVSAKQREQCKTHLPQVAEHFRPELSNLCNDMGLVDEVSGNAEFDINELEDDKARRLVDFVKRKMKRIIASENTGVYNDAPPAAPATSYDTTINHAPPKPTFDDSGDELDTGVAAMPDFDPFDMPDSFGHSNPSSNSGSFDDSVPPIADSSSSWEAAQRGQDQQELSQTNMANAENNAGERASAEYEANARKVKEDNERMAREKQEEEDRRRHQQTADDIKREEERRAQVSERDYQASQDTFDQADEEEYDPYGLDFD